MSKIDRPQPVRTGPAAQKQTLPPLRNTSGCAARRVRVRSFRKHDLLRLYQLDQNCFAPDIAYSMADLKYFLCSARCSSWVAEAPRETVAGFIIVERSRQEGNMTGHLVTIDVEPQMRRQGVGCLLLNAAEEQLKTEGVSLMTLEVAEDNVGAQAFYRRQGFADAGVIPQYYAGRLDAQVMKKQI
jgi:[ribosomal protein S18]-alanine N-acetyltransferase